MKKLAIISTHPIQYHAPLFRLLHESKSIEVKVFYTWGEGVMKNKYDPGFGKVVSWDIPLVSGYNHTFVKNVSKDPGSHHFTGIDNPSLISEIKEWKPDALLVYGWSFKSHMKVLRHFSRQIKILFRGDSTMLDEREGASIKKALRQLFLRWLYKHIDSALYVGTANKTYYKSMGLKDHQLVFAPHAIDNMRFEQPTRNFRADLGIPEEAIVFLYAGKLEPKKNPELLLRSFIELHELKSHLLIIGNGIMEPSLKLLVDALSVELKRRIHFMDFQNQTTMPSVYHSADIFVLPSMGPNETWGLAVNEAMAAGNAILVSDKCGCSIDLVGDGINGFIFKSNDKDDLTNKMQRICRDSLELKKMKRASKEKISYWNFETVAKAIESSVLETSK